MDITFNMDTGTVRLVLVALSVWVIAGSAVAIAPVKTGGKG